MEKVYQTAVCMYIKVRFPWMLMLIYLASVFLFKIFEYGAPSTVIRKESNRESWNIALQIVGDQAHYAVCMLVKTLYLKNLLHVFSFRVHIRRFEEHKTESGEEGCRML